LAEKSICSATARRDLTTRFPVMMPIFRFFAALAWMVALTAIGFCTKADGQGTPPAYQVAWIHQYGTTSWDRAFGIATDGLGNLYTSGETLGSIGTIGPTNAGQYDAFTARYDTAGNAQWSTQLGNSGSDFGTSIAADSLGNVYSAGYTQGALPSVGYQASLTSYSPAGSVNWTQTLGTPQTYAYGVTTDGMGNAYVAGSTLGTVSGLNLTGGYMAYVAKYNSAGGLQWADQFGTSAHDQAYAIASDGTGSVYVAGATTGSLGGANAGKNDAFVRKYSVNGTVQWTEQLGTPADDFAKAVAADSMGNVFIAGSTSGALAGNTSAGLDDAFVSKFNTTGTLQWSTQIGTSGNDYISAATTDSHGDVFVAGYTQGSLGNTNAGNYDAFVSELDGAGNLLWTRQLGTPAADYIGGITIDAKGNIYVSGSTLGSLAGSNQGSYDAWIARLSAPVLGDLSHDFQLTNADIQALISALTNPTAFKQSLGLTNADYLALGDVNGDGQVNAADISALMSMLAGNPVPSQSDAMGSTTAVPEPGSAMLWMIGISAFLLFRAARTKRQARFNSICPRQS
jgi:Beta-propeller repeat/Dockerin type I domain